MNHLTENQKAKIRDLLQKKDEKGADRLFKDFTAAYLESQAESLTSEYSGWKEKAAVNLDYNKEMEKAAKNGFNPFWNR